MLTLSRLAFAYGVTLDWIYLGRMDSLSQQLVQKLQPILKRPAVNH